MFITCLNRIGSSHVHKAASSGGEFFVQRFPRKKNRNFKFLFMLFSFIIMVLRSAKQRGDGCFGFLVVWFPKFRHGSMQIRAHLRGQDGHAMFMM